MESCHGLIIREDISKQHKHPWNAPAAFLRAEGSKLCCERCSYNHLRHPSATARGDLLLACAIYTTKSTTAVKNIKQALEHRAWTNYKFFTFHSSGPGLSGSRGGSWSSSFFAKPAITSGKTLFTSLHSFGILLIEKRTRLLQSEHKLPCLQLLEATGDAPRSCLAKKTS